jgi:3-deoxy-manno-octulosonate cytidylyltransferase (CMP-KDO synthetase)
MKPNVICIIPARAQSTRLANKMLAAINGQPLIQRTYQQARQCPDLTEIVVATDSAAIAKVIHQVGGKTAMPTGQFQTGSERVAAAACHYHDDDIIINLQGDEPFVQPAMLTTLIQPYLEDKPPPYMTTLANPLINADGHYDDPNRVKVIYDQQYQAIYFSRAPIPYLRHTMRLDSLPVLRHIGIYAFQNWFLQRYAHWPQTPLERAESLEQLRVLEKGYSIQVCPVQQATLEINTPEELQQAQQLLAQS